MYELRPILVLYTDDTSGLDQTATCSNTTATATPSCGRCSSMQQLTAQQLCPEATGVEVARRAVSPGRAAPNSRTRHSLRPVSAKVVWKTTFVSASRGAKECWPVHRAGQREVGAFKWRVFSHKISSVKWKHKPLKEQTMRGNPCWMANIWLKIHAFSTPAIKKTRRDQRMVFGGKTHNRTTRATRLHTSVNCVHESMEVLLSCHVWEDLRGNGTACNWQIGVRTMRTDI